MKYPPVHWQDNFYLLVISASAHAVAKSFYEFHFGEEMHYVAERKFSRFANPQEGEKRELYVDAETMDEIYEPIRAGRLRISVYARGLCLVAVSIIGLYMMYVVR